MSSLKQHLDYSIFDRGNSVHLEQLVPKLSSFVEVNELATVFEPTTSMLAIFKRECTRVLQVFNIQSHFKQFFRVVTEVRPFVSDGRISLSFLNHILSPYFDLFEMILHCFNHINHNKLAGGSLINFIWTTEQTSRCPICCLYSVGKLPLSSS